VENTIGASAIANVAFENLADMRNSSQQLSYHWSYNLWGSQSHDWGTLAEKHTKMV
jgi:hypothetical protein